MFWWGQCVIGTFLIRIGVKILPKDVHDMVRGMLLYHVPGALTEFEKGDVRAAKAEWLSKHKIELKM